MQQRLSIENGNIKDSLTGLEWQVWALTKLSWYEAMSLRLADGWRMPTLGELRMLWEVGQEHPEILPQDEEYWSASKLYPSDHDIAPGHLKDGIVVVDDYRSRYAFAVRFKDGIVGYYDRYNSFSARLVRDSQMTLEHTPKTT